MTETNVTVNSTYKARIFEMVFSDRKELLALYNAVNGTCYTNPGYNEKLKAACKALRDYAEYTARVRRYAQMMSLEDAVEAAISECIREEILSDFLMANKTEAKKMSIYEYDEELHMRQTREEGWEDGFSQGETSGKLTERIETILDFLKDLGTIPEDLHQLIMNQKDLSALKQWVKLAAKVDSIEDFQKQISL